MSKFWIAATAACLLALSGTAMAADAWPTFRDPKGAFSVDMPGAPATNTEAKTGRNGEPLPLVTYHFDGDDLAMLVMDGDFTASPSPIALAGIPDGMRSRGYNITSQDPITIDGHTGIKMVILDDKNHLIIDRAFAVNQHLYQVITVVDANPSADVSSRADRFAASFHFTN